MKLIKKRIYSEVRDRLCDKVESILIERFRSKGKGKITCEQGKAAIMNMVYNGITYQISEEVEAIRMFV